jgi:hypothetical protein
MIGVLYGTSKLFDHFNILFQLHELVWPICQRNNNGILSLHKFSYYTLLLRKCSPCL